MRLTWQHFGGFEEPRKWNLQAKLGLAKMENQFGLAKMENQLSSQVLTFLKYKIRRKNSFEAS